VADRYASRLSVAAAQAALGSPLFGAIRPWLERLPRERFPTLDELNALVEPGMITGGGQPLRFVRPAPTQRGFQAQYEVRIFRTGEVPTREDNWHDLFNALAWFAFPTTKAAFNARHYDLMRQAVRERGELRGPRGTARDVLTLFDEGGMIVISCDEQLLELLRDFRWKELFCARRPQVLERMQFFVFGHALYEKALDPYKGVTAKSLLLGVRERFLSADLRARLDGIDGRAALWFLGPEALTSSRTLAPLPVLGVPGWAKNDEPAFYDDEHIFRRGYSSA
jgi:hypothetical protein